MAFIYSFAGMLCAFIVGCGVMISVFAVKDLFVIKYNGWKYERMWVYRNKLGLPIRVQDEHPSTLLDDIEYMKRVHKKAREGLDVRT